MGGEHAHSTQETTAQHIVSACDKSLGEQQHVAQLWFTKHSLVCRAYVNMWKNTFLSPTYLEAVTEG